MPEYLQIHHIRVWATTKQSKEKNRQRFFIATILVGVKGVRRSLLSKRKHKRLCLLSACRRLSFRNVLESISQPHPLTHVTNFTRDLKSASNSILSDFSPPAIGGKKSKFLGFIIFYFSTSKKLVNENLFLPSNWIYPFLFLALPFSLFLVWFNLSVSM